MAEATAFRLLSSGQTGPSLAGIANRYQANAGSLQTLSGATPFQGITRTVWIPGPTASSRNDATVESSGKNARKVDLPVDQKPAGLCGEKKGSLLRSEVNGDVNLPMPPTQPRKVDVPVDQRPAGTCEVKGSLLRSEVNGDVNLPVQSPDDLSRATEMVQKLAQRIIPYSDWYRIGLALYAGFGEAGRPLWDLFLANPHYQDTQRGLDAKWNSFRGVREITLATLFEIGGRHGIN